MLTPCHECGHALWSEVRRVGACRFIVHFDDDEHSGTYAERVMICPGCGASLVGHAHKRHGLASRPRPRLAVRRSASIR